MASFAGNDKMSRSKNYQNIAFDAFIESLAQQARHKISEHTIPTERIMKTLSLSLDVSDRDAAIIIFALIDDLSKSFLTSKLIGSVSSGIENSFFKTNGMLSSAYNKLLLMGGLEWITHDTYHDLSILRKIRNHFAHNVEFSDFNQEVIHGHISSMNKREQLMIKMLPDGEKPKKLSPRDLFLIRSSLAVLSLVRDMIYIDTATKYNISPNHIMQKGGDVPLNVKELTKAILSHSLDLIIEEAEI